MMMGLCEGNWFVLFFILLKNLKINKLTIKKINSSVRFFFYEKFSMTYLFLRL